MIVIFLFMYIPSGTGHMHGGVSVKACTELVLHLSLQCLPCKHQQSPVKREDKHIMAS